VKTVAIVAKPAKPELHTIGPEVVQWLLERDYRVFVDEEGAAYVPGLEVVEREDIPTVKPDFVVVLGGDGTLLSAARAVATADIPILGVNLGSLGFLTEVPLHELYPTLDAVHENRCAVELRGMLHTQLVRNGECVASYEALNDAVVNKSAIARLVNIDLFIDQVFVSNYRADGLIVATPTGSTGYSLAAGGPILMPSVDAFVISPVSPHSLTHRPVVVRDSAEVEVVVTGAQEEIFLSIDGQVGMPLFDGDRVVCRKSQHKVKLLRLKKTFFELLRNKLKWGSDRAIG
jgi:NAD+ kinase